MEELAEAIKEGRKIQFRDPVIDANDIQQGVNEFFKGFSLIERGILRVMREAGPDSNRMNHVRQVMAEMSESMLSAVPRSAAAMGFVMEDGKLE
jgi:hypothetical protein